MVPRTRSAAISTRLARWVLAAQVILLAPSLGAQLPERLSDQDYWKLVGEISEAGGYFRMDNFTSNEGEVGRLATMLRDAGHSGGVYMGVGPEQNFTYIAAIRPKMVFITDIRRQAVMQHLMYKAMFEMSADRADFISILFSLPRPAELDTSAAIARIWDAYSLVPANAAKHASDYTRIIDNLTKKHGFSFTEDEISYLRYVYDSFFRIGPWINANGARGGGGGGGRGGRGGGNFMTLTQAADDMGVVRSFLASEETFRVVKDLHERNLIVPASGDFGGPHAIRAVGKYVQSKGATVTAFYVSNVEQYLFQDNKWRQFYDNVATLPLTDRSVFIRPYALRQYSPPAGLCPIVGYIKAYREGRVFGYQDSLRCAQ